MKPADSELFPVHSGAGPPDRAPLVRSPVFVLRALCGVVLFAIGIVGLLVFEQSLLGLRADVIAMEEWWPGWMVDSVEVAVWLTLAAAIVGTNVVLLVRRRYRGLLLINAAAAAAIMLGAVAGHVVLALAPSDAVEQALEDASTDSLGNDLLASVVAVVTIAFGWIASRLRPSAIGLVAAAASLSLLGGAVSVITLPFDVGVGLLAGGSVALVLRTRDRTPTPHQLAEALAVSGVDVAHVERAAVDARGSVPWLVRTVSGDELFVKIRDSDQRAADLLFRLVRALRLRRTGDHRPFASLRRAAEHEAFLSLAAESQDVRTPHLVTVRGVGTDEMLLAYERLDGTSLDRVDPRDCTSTVLEEVWRCVADLRAVDIAHRDLRLANLFLDDDGEVWLIDFGFAELAADEVLLARDVAELVASTSAAFGAHKAVETAVSVLGARTVATSIPWIQPLALSSATREHIGGRDGCAALRVVAATATSSNPSTARLARVGPWTMIASTVGTRFRVGARSE